MTPRALGLGLVLATWGASGATAQAPAPFGTWQGENTGDLLQLLGDGSCSASGMVNVAGRCGWNPTSTGGILTMEYYGLPEVAYLYYNITWLDQNTLLVNSVERFVRIQ